MATNEVVHTVEVDHDMVAMVRMSALQRNYPKSCKALLKFIEAMEKEGILTDDLQQPLNHFVFNEMFHAHLIKHENKD